jgi:hypothetical protein
MSFVDAWGNIDNVGKIVYYIIGIDTALMAVFLWLNRFIFLGV